MRKFLIKIVERRATTCTTTNVSSSKDELKLDDCVVKPIWFAMVRDGLQIVCNDYSNCNPDINNQSIIL